MVVLYSKNFSQVPEIILLSVALINQKCIYSTLNVINAFPSLGKHLAFSGNYLFPFVERGTSCKGKLSDDHDPAEDLHTRFRDFIHHVSPLE